MKRTALRGTFRSYAKINLGLEVLGRRADGYHELRTIFREIGLFDTLDIRVASHEGPIVVHCSDPSVPSDERNLAARAALALRDACGAAMNRAVTIRIKKRIPAGGGLGGGSSNAATVLLALHRLLRLKTSARQLHAIARRLGADVAFFLTGGTALGTSRGDVIRPLRLKVPSFAVLAWGAAGVSTAAVFEALARDRATHQSQRGKTASRSPIRSLIASASRRGGDPDSAAFQGLRNDLEPPATSIEPRLEAARRAIRDACARAGGVVALMSGSGSTFFALAQGRKEANAMLRILGPLGYSTRLVSTSPRRVY